MTLQKGLVICYYYPATFFRQEKTSIEETRNGIWLKWFADLGGREVWRMMAAEAESLALALTATAAALTLLYLSTAAYAYLRRLVPGLATNYFFLFHFCKNHWSAWGQINDFFTKRKSTIYTYIIEFDTLWLSPANYTSSQSILTNDTLADRGCHCASTK